MLDGSLSPFEEGFFFSPPSPDPFFFPGKSAKEKWEGGYPLVEMDREKRINSGHVPEGREGGREGRISLFLLFSLCGMLDRWYTTSSYMGATLAKFSQV